MLAIKKKKEESVAERHNKWLASFPGRANEEVCVWPVIMASANSIKPRFCPPTVTLDHTQICFICVAATFVSRSSFIARHPTDAARRDEPSRTNGRTADNKGQPLLCGVCFGRSFFTHSAIGSIDSRISRLQLKRIVSSKFGRARAPFSSTMKAGASAHERMAE